MTNEQLAGFIQSGGNDELIPILWERIRKLMYMKSDKVYNALQGRFQQCGVEVWDLKAGLLYGVSLKAVEGFKPLILGTSSLLICPTRLKLRSTRFYAIVPKRKRTSRLTIVQALICR